MSDWLDPWPTWRGRWFGWALRAALGLSGSLLGAFFVLIANVGADFMRNDPQWDTEALVILLSGIAMLIASVWVFSRPSKASTTTYAATVAWILGVVQI